jgi:hypothetical protein
MIASPAIADETLRADVSKVRQHLRPDLDAGVVRTSGAHRPRGRRARDEAVCEDPDDDKYLAAALGAGAVHRDRNRPFLSLQEYQGVRVVTCGHSAKSSMPLTGWGLVDFTSMSSHLARGTAGEPP